MKLLDKLKNALFEEEYVEVEEKVKKTKEKAEKKSKKAIKEEVEIEKNYQEEKPIAKRIIPMDKVVEEEKEEVSNDNLLKRNGEPKITAYDDEDLMVDTTSYIPKLPPISEVTKRRVDNNYDEMVYEEKKGTVEKEESIPQPEEKTKEKPEVKLYQASKKDDYLDNYTPHEYGNYEKQKEKQTFKPSPIISPVYGIVEDTRFMEKPKREIRITTSISHDKINIDDIRRKAYGNLSDDISDNIGLHSEIEEESESLDEDNVLLDLTDDSSTPEVNNLTVGDAVEYFEDLGLEYNEDYVDASSNRGSSKHALDDQEAQDNQENQDVQEESEYIDTDLSNEELDDNVEEDLPRILDDEDQEEDSIIVKEKDSDATTDSDNLFDLIDSMYE